MILSMDLGPESYNIVIKRGVLTHASEHFDLNRKVLIVTDGGVPAEYAQKIASQSQNPFIEIFPQGEEHKNIQTYQSLLQRMVKEGFSRSDCVVAVGGGVCGDMAGFAAASYMRGIVFYNVPTTLLSQVDSSIGGKVAIDFDGYKNIVGAFHQPKGVLIDPDVLQTLPPRRIADGMAEVIKMAATCDADLFQFIEENEPMQSIETIIEGVLKIKKNVVEQDPKEQGLRRVLNFGHSVGHAIESTTGFSVLYHGECVALGMLVMAVPEVRDRLKKVLKKVGLPTEYSYDSIRIIEAMKMDKKVSDGTLTVVTVPKIGSFEFKKIPLDELETKMKEVL